MTDGGIAGVALAEQDVISLSIHGQATARTPVKKPDDPCAVKFKCHKDPLIFICRKIKVSWCKKRLKRDNNLFIVKKRNFYLLVINLCPWMLIDLIRFLLFFPLLADDFSLDIYRVGRNLKGRHVQSFFFLKLQPRTHINIVS